MAGPKLSIVYKYGRSQVVNFLNIAARKDMAGRKWSPVFKKKKNLTTNVRSLREKNSSRLHCFVT
jgi:hypothetical protein